MIETMFRRTVKQGEVIIRQVLRVCAAGRWCAIACRSLVVVQVQLALLQQGSAGLQRLAQELAGALRPATQPAVCRGAANIA